MMSKTIVLTIVFVVWFIRNVANEWQYGFYCDSCWDFIRESVYLILHSLIIPVITCGILYIIFF